MTTTKQLKAAIDEARQNYDDKATYLGEYHGKWYHEGVAIAFDRSYTMTIIKTLLEYCPNIGEPDQKDDLAFEALWSWDKSKFSDGKEPVARDEDE